MIRWLRLHAFVISRIRILQEGIVQYLIFIGGFTVFDALGIFDFDSSYFWLLALVTLTVVYRDLRGLRKEEQSGRVISANAN